jgi:hypothetical protein
MGLRLYTVHLPPSASDDTTPVVIKEGFSWGAFIFGVIWTLWYRLWIEAAALLALFLAFGVIADFINLSEPVQSAILLAVAVLIGFAGNDWRRESLRRRGFLEAAVVSGPDPENALRRFLDLHAAESRAVAAPAPYQDPAALFPAPLPVTAPAAPGGATGSIAGWYASTYQPPGQLPSDTNHGNFGFPDNGAPDFGDSQDRGPRR